MRHSLLLILVFIGIAVQAKQRDREVIGCKPVFENRVFMSTTEVSNLSYREFIFSISKDGGEITSLLPDTTDWRNKGSYNEPYVEYYFRHPAYNDYPVVGVSKEQAEAFCAWLSKTLTDVYRKDDKSDIDSVVVRLPTKLEWIDAAKGGNDYYEYPWKGHSLRWEEGKHQGSFRANCIRGRGDYMGIAGHLNDYADVTAPVQSYWANDYGLYNCSGNVAEMVADDNVAMGGSWNSYGNDIKVTSEMPADSSSARIGFRYLVEVVKLKEEKPNNFNVDKKFVKNHISMRDSVGMSNYEVSNQLYNLFLKENRHQVQDTSVWDSTFIYSNWFTCNYRWHPMYANHPAVGMTKTDALEFCKWLTQRLKPFYDYPIQVDLPTEEEWEYFARGGLELSPYPWGGPYLRNYKGSFLANFKVVPEAFLSRDADGKYSARYPRGKHAMFGADLDGYLETAAVDAFHPNDYGQYCFAGNVREMIKDSDEYTRGGGWNSIDYYLQTSSREEIQSMPAPDIGFRFVVRIKS